jgi:hypothetical protein
LFVRPDATADAEEEQERFEWRSGVRLRLRSAEFKWQPTQDGSWRD